MTGRRITIGEFAKAGDVSVQALRHYDKSGVLKPEHVAPGTGYRFYAEGQIFHLNNIKMLQEVGFTLQEIAELGGCNTIPALLDAYQEKADRLDERIAMLRRARRQVVWYRELLGRMLRPHHPFDEGEIGRIKEYGVPEQRLLSVRARVVFDYPSMLLLYNQLLKKVFERRCGIEPGLVTIFHGGYEGIYHRRTDLALAFRLPPASRRGKRQPPQRFLGCLHRGKYPSSIADYERLLVHAETLNLRVAGPVQHILHIPIAATGDAGATVFEVRIPLAR